MYVRRAVGSFSGIYTMRMWAEAPENTTVIVQIFQRSEGDLSYYWTFRNGMFYGPGPDQPIGNEISWGDWELYNPYIWKVCSESEETVFHIRVKFERFNPWFPHGYRSEQQYERPMNPLLILLIVLLLLGPAFAILDKVSYTWDRRQRRKAEEMKQRNRSY
jgi:hypothetical protein